MLLRRDRAMLAITVMLDIAFHGGRARTVSAADLAARLGQARRGMEPLLQALSRAGLLESLRGPRGGYRLGRPRREIRLSDITHAARGEPAPDPSAAAGALEGVTERLWDELEVAVETRLAALTLDDLLRRAEAAGLRRPAGEPISFTI